MTQGFVEYVGFWRRCLARLLDVLFFMLLAMIALFLVHGERFFHWLVYARTETIQIFSAVHFMMDYVMPMIITVLMWVKFRGTPGKLLLSCVVVDANSHNRLSLLQALIRYFSYIVSLLPLGLGFFWIAWDRKKQGFHDKIARTIVIVEDEADKSLAELNQELC